MSGKVDNPGVPLWMPFVIIVTLYAVLFTLQAMLER
jgi:hypothetical protein